MRKAFSIRPPYVFAQGYLPWMWGDTPQNPAKHWRGWRSKVRNDGSFR